MPAVQSPAGLRRLSGRMHPTAMTDARLLLCTCPDEASAARIARTLVDERLAACVSRVPGLLSTYRWDGQVQEDAEVLLLIKTTADAVEALQARLLELHPYEVPEMIALDIAAGLPAYLDWLRDSVSVSDPPPGTVIMDIFAPHASPRPRRGPESPDAPHVPPLPPPAAGRPGRPGRRCRRRWPRSRSTACCRSARPTRSPPRRHAGHDPPALDHRARTITCTAAASRSRTPAAHATLGTLQAARRAEGARPVPGRHRDLPPRASTPRCPTRWWTRARRSCAGGEDAGLPRGRPEDLLPAVHRHADRGAARRAGAGSTANRADLLGAAGHGKALLGAASAGTSPRPRPARCRPSRPSASRPSPPRRTPCCCAGPCPRATTCTATAPR